MVRSFGFILVLLGAALVMLGVRVPGISGSLIEWVRASGNLRGALLLFGGLLVLYFGIGFICVRLALRLGLGLLVLQQDNPIRK